jgi:hypothetical protein
LNEGSYKFFLELDCVSGEQLVESDKIFLIIREKWLHLKKPDIFLEISGKKSKVVKKPDIFANDIRPLTVQSR